MKTIGIVQARMTSSRLPGKIMLPLDGQPSIIFQLQRLRLSHTLDDVVLATSLDPSDDIVESTARDAGFNVFRGSLHDVLDRYRACAVHFSADVIVRLTGDCPLTDPFIVDEVVNYFQSSGCDYVCNTLDDSALSVPDGFDVEVFSISALRQAAISATIPSDREHVTSWFTKNPKTIKTSHYAHKVKYPYYRITVDEYADYQVVSSIIRSRSKDSNHFFGIQHIVEVLESHPEISSLNAGATRNSGYYKSVEEDPVPLSRPDKVPGIKCHNGQRLWTRARNIIPGGNFLLSKRPEMFLPERWPSYYSHASGCEIVDLDGNSYIDMSIMGIGTNLLGYNNKEVNKEVVGAIRSSNMSTLNSPHEVYLAEKLVALHSWADMARFARTGGEANAVAVRIARAATGRDTVAICGYHGWHDWYLATNLQNTTGLSEHLLPGLSPTGVPSSLAGTVIPFSYNNLEQIRQIATDFDLGAIKMEVQRSSPPNPDFLEGIRSLCDAKGIVLIFDECTSGFRESFGGLHLKYGVDPDMAMFGKALGNGFAITAVIGKRSIMQAAQNTFMSSTFWTERIGPVAALKTLEIMEREHTWEYVTSIGKYMKESWKLLADKYNIEIGINGLDALAGFEIIGRDPLKYKTYITQEMLKSGYLASTSFYASTSHTHNMIDRYLDVLDPIFESISACESGNLSIDEILESPICHAGFNRLN